MTEAQTITTDTSDELDSQTSSEIAEAPQRNPDGTFPKGVSGNPAGRPKGRKNRITQLKQDLEIALRENLNAKQVEAVIQAMLAEALNGNVGAGKLILDKVISNAKEADEEKDLGGGLKIVIEQANIESFSKQDNVIDATATEVIPNGEERKPVSD